MPSDLSSYLATHYLTADSGKPSKKRKRKHDKSSGAGGGLLIQDDDDWGSGSGRKSSKYKANDDGEEDDLPVTVGQVKEIRKTTKANWKTVGGGAPKKDANDESAAADAILASAAAEHAAARAAEDDDPTVVEEASAAAAARMADGSHAGLQSAAAVTAQLARRQREEREQFEAERRAGLVQHGDEAETYYRDATGRRVDASMQRAAARRAAAEAEDNERAEREALRGEVQVEEARRRREELDAARGLGVARTADDEEMNRELREQRRWNDPMARFLDVEEAGAGGSAGEGGGGGGGKAGKKASRRPVCKHSAPPNRYGIRPGHRWDGVDRSNGFEAERFKALNRRERNKGLDYAWQMDE